jgi:hypothetical protein
MVAAEAVLLQKKRLAPAMQTRARASEDDVNFMMDVIFRVLAK